jgi:protein TonB
VRPLRLVLRFRAPRTPASRCVLYSLVTHLVLLVTLVFLPSLRGPRSISESALVVDLVSFPTAPAALPTPAGAAVAAPPAPVPPAPQPTEPSPEARLETRVPEPVQEERPPDPKPSAPPPEPAPRNPAPPPVDPSAQPAPGEPSGPPGEAGATITAMEGADDFELGWYRASVTAALFANWRKPILEGMTEPREVRVTFEIQRDGRVSGVAVEGSSGVPSLDRSALRAVADAAPLPPLPANWREPTLSAGFIFRLYPE